MSYYGELCTRIYEIDKSLASGKELDFYLSFADNKDIRVLEPMCGNGRMLIPFMQQGISIEGFDISEDMLQACREKGDKLNLKPHVYFQKIEEFFSPSSFDLIMIPFGSFSLVPSELVNQSLANMKSVLKVQGRLLLTIMFKSNDIQEIPEWIESGKWQVEDGWIVGYKKVHYDNERFILTTRLKYQLMKEDRVIQTEIMNFPVRLYEKEEFEQTLRSIGFGHIELHEVKDGYGQGTSFHVFECGIGA
jgi:Methylase involved in ubiquinone/menaquinone biosynthesis